MDKALKQRMVGASVLIALAVVVLPMLLGGRSERGTQQTQKIELPAQPPELNFETRRYPTGELNPVQQAKKDESQQEEPPRPLPAPKIPVIKADQPGTAGSTVVKSEIQDQSSARAPASLGPVENESSSDSGRYVVQVASFGALDNANKLSATLRDNGYSVMTDSVIADVGTLHRVRIGPYASEAEANGAVLDLESKINDIKPRVMDLQPGKSGQIIISSDPLIRWILQVGSFSSAVNAEELVASLRLDGLSAYQETVSASGPSIYRVRIGPFLQREDAIRLERKMREERSLDGVVMSAD